MSILNIMSDETIKLLNELKTEVETLKNKLARQEKAFKKFKKSLIPEEEKKVRKPSGFAKPTFMSNEMCDFLGEPYDTEMPRTEVTKRILKYVKDNDLQNKTERRFIDLDESLEKLLKPEKDFRTSYFNIQKLLKVHYLKEKTKDEPVKKVKKTKKV